MQGDEYFSFLHFYLQKGFDLEYLLGLGCLERSVFRASMAAALAERREVLEKWAETVPMKT